MDSPRPVNRRRRPTLGRKDYAALLCLLGPTTACTVMAFLRIMTPETYVGFLQIYIPAVLVPYFGGNVAQKVLALRAGGQGGES